MHTEYEAKFLNVDKDSVRQRLLASGATLVKPDFLQKRHVFQLPAEKHSPHAFARVREESGVVTLTWKKFTGADADHPQEIELIVDDFDNAVEFVKELGCIPKSFQESYRELWRLGEAKITIDTWPFMEPFVEIESTTEEAVKRASIGAGFEWSAALFCSVTKLFKMKYGGHVNIRDMPRLTFDMPNPFV